MSKLSEDSSGSAFNSDSSSKILTSSVETGSQFLSWLPTIILCCAILLPIMIYLVQASANLARRIATLGLNIADATDKGIKMPVKVLDTFYPYGIVECRGGRPYMEDRNLVVSKIKGNMKASLFGLFDGHGGDFASEYVAKNLASVVSSSTHDLFTETEACLSFAFKQVDRQLLDQEIIAGVVSGTTAISLFVHDKKLTVANAGDSRAVLVHQNGLTKPLSSDHKPDRKDERERITKLGGVIVHWGVWRVEGLLAVSRSLGDPLLKKFVIPDPEFISHTITERDSFVVLATDGLWDVINNDELAPLLNSCDDPQTAANLLCIEALTRGTPDNITVVVIDLRDRAIKNNNINNNTSNNNNNNNNSSSSSSNSNDDDTKKKTLMNGTSSTPESSSNNNPIHSVPKDARNKNNQSDGVSL